MQDVYITGIRRAKRPKIKKGEPKGFSLNTWQRAILTMAGIAIFTAGMLNFCVRDGYRCDHSALATRFLSGHNSLKTK